MERKEKSEVKTLSVKHDKHESDIETSQISRDRKTSRAASSAYTVKTKTYVVNLREGQVASIVLKPNTRVTVAVDQKGDLYPEVLRSLINTNVLIEENTE